MKQGASFCLSMIFCVVSHAQQENILAIDSSNIQSIRNEIYDSLFGNEPIPEFQLLTKKGNWSRYATQYPPDSVERIEVGEVKMKHGFTSKIYIIHPLRDNGLNVPVIYHSGHGYGVFREDALVNFNNDTAVGSSTISHFLSKGFTVVGIDMPFYGENTWPEFVVENDYLYPMYGHNDVFYLDNPFYYFLAPVKSVIDYLQTNRHCDEFVMYGLSGGGWATTVYSAMDPRIRLSFPIAGTAPIPLRQARDSGDIEQYYTPFYDRFNYSTLYFLGAAGAGRQQYQVLIKKDNCCFSFDGYQLWEGYIQNALKESGLPGSFQFYYDTVSNYHRISSLAVDSMQTHVVADMIEEKMNKMFSLNSSRQSNTICDNDTIQLSVSSVGTNTVDWFYEDKKIDSTKGYRIRIGREGQYHAVVHNLSGGVVSLPPIEIKRQNVFTRPVISRSGNVLYSSYTSGNWWYLNGKRVGGTTSNSLLLSKPGRYTLRVHASTCTSDYSEPLDFGVNAFPNPSTSNITVRLSRDLGKVSYSLCTFEGSAVIKGEFTGETVIHYPDFIKPGLYFLALSNNGGFRHVQRIILQK